MSRVARSDSRADVLATLAIVALVVGVVAGRSVLRRLSAHPSPAECAALLERYAELVARAVDPAPAPSGIVKRKEAAQATLREHGFSRCETELTQAEMTCALQAGSADELERCLP